MFSKNPDRLLDGDIARRFLAAVTGHAEEVRGLLSDEHFSVDGTLIEAWARVKSFRPKDGGDGPPGPGRNAARHFHGERRTNDTHARLCRKGRGKEAKLAHMGHPLMETAPAWWWRSGWRRRPAGPSARRPSRRGRGGARPPPDRAGGQSGHDTGDFVATLRTLNVTAHVAQNASGRRSRIDGRTTRHPGYAAGQRTRKRIEEAFGWIKGGAGQRKTRFRGSGRVGWAFTLAT